MSKIPAHSQQHCLWTCPREESSWFIFVGVEKMFVISKPQNILNTYRETRSFHSKKGLFSPGRKTTLARTGSNCTSLEQLQKINKKCCLWLYCTERKQIVINMSHVCVCVYLHICERHSKSNIFHLYEKKTKNNMECSCNIANISYFSWRCDNITVTLQPIFFQTPN